MVVQFCNHSYDYRPNRTPLSPLTTINCFLYSSDLVLPGNESDTHKISTEEETETANDNFSACQAVDAPTPRNLEVNDEKVCDETTAYSGSSSRNDAEAEETDKELLPGAVRTEATDGEIQGPDMQTIPHDQIFDVQSGLGTQLSAFQQDATMSIGLIQHVMYEGMQHKDISFAAQGGFSDLIVLIFLLILILSGCSLKMYIYIYIYK